MGSAHTSSASHLCDTCGEAKHLCPHPQNYGPSIPAHTPGPWAVLYSSYLDHHVSVGSDAHDIVVAHVPSWDGEADSAAQAKANARLIAAAPTQNDALKAVQQFFDTLANHFDEDTEMGRELDRVARLVNVALDQAAGN